MVVPTAVVSSTPDGGETDVGVCRPSNTGDAGRGRFKESCRNWRTVSPLRNCVVPARVVRFGTSSPPAGRARFDLGFALFWADDALSEPPARCQSAETGPCWSRAITSSTFVPTLAWPWPGTTPASEGGPHRTKSRSRADRSVAAPACAAYGNAGSRRDEEPRSVLGCRQKEPRNWTANMAVGRLVRQRSVAARPSFASSEGNGRAV
ncbi:hypothetical protein DCS_05751 [Drechmeria coniospora]|uniref:Uncharacterized protein n=1 Tax=Drechmeria coniospora TaxID=98403 RepID=A0A151GNN9_DRECN|nr:hypothetical protein DCS_05751 [Drechmeria coniospora]KYK58734.1 hypothetical protein DCS_05751 [Drechmeria coniospora]